VCPREAFAKNERSKRLESAQRSLGGIETCFSLPSCMTRLSTSDAGIVSAIVAISILLGSIPLSGGIVIASYPNQPTFTFNICAPLHVGLSVSGTPIARPATSPPRLVLLEDGRVPPNLPK
jgi:hypothetical protein